MTNKNCKYQGQCGLYNASDPECTTTPEHCRYVDEIKRREFVIITKSTTQLIHLEELALKLTTK